jgi:hypothetical protein
MTGYQLLECSTPLVFNVNEEQRDKIAEHEELAKGRGSGVPRHLVENDEWGSLYILLHNVNARRQENMCLLLH